MDLRSLNLKEVLNDRYPIYTAPLGPRSVDGRHRPAGCIFSYKHHSMSSQVPVFHGRRQSLPIQGSSIMNLISTESFHQDHGSGYSISLNSAYHIRVDGFSPFSHPLAKWFLKGLFHLYPLVKKQAKLCDLPLVLRCFTCCLFEPAVICDIRLLSFMTLFLVAITLVHHVSKLTALDIRPPFTEFLPHVVKPSTNISFLPKVVSEFHMHKDIILPNFFQDPKTQVERTLLWMLPGLFECYQSSEHFFYAEPNVPP